MSAPTSVPAHRGRAVAVVAAWAAFVGAVILPPLWALLAAVVGISAFRARKTRRMRLELAPRARAELTRQRKLRLGQQYAKWAHW
jgi:hypothetical protein